MTLPSLAYRRTYPLRGGFTVTFSLDGLQLQAEWSPDLPSRKQAHKLMKPYRLARHRFIASLGVNAMVPSEVITQLISTSYVTDSDPSDGLIQATGTTITVETHARTYTDRTVTVTGGSITTEDDGTTALTATTTYHVYYDDGGRLAGLAATTNGQSFAVDNGDGTVSIYRKVSGSAVFQRKIGTTEYNDGRFALKSAVNDFVNGIAETVVATLENPSTADAASLRRALSIASVEAMKSAALNINGNHRVSQEVGAVEQTGIGSASPGTQKWMTDGHKLWVQGTARVKAQQVTVSDLPGFNRALRVEVTTAQPTIGSDFIRHLTFCETDRFLPCAWGTPKARDLVRYAWVKTSMAGAYDVVILNGNRAVASEVSTFTVDAPNTWQLVKTVIPAVTFASDWTASGMGYRCEIALAGGGSPNLAAEVGHYFQTTGEVFLPADYDLGLSDTALLMPTLQENFAACQRIYQKSYNMSTVPGTAATFGGSIQRITDVAASFHTLGHIHFGVPMAGIPSITLYSPNSGATGKCYDANGTADVNATVVDAGAQGFNAFINSVSVAATRTLSFQFVADARIG